MKRQILNWLGVGMLGVLAVNASLGQVPPGYPPSYNPVRPSYSPYLNLLRPGNPAVNYYGLVRPEMETLNFLNQVERQVTRLQNTPQTIITPGLPPTGHTVGFMNASRYFLTFEQMAGGSGSYSLTVPGKFLGGVQGLPGPQGGIASPLGMQGTQLPSVGSSGIPAPSIGIPGLR